MLDRALQLGAIERVRALHPFDVVLAMVACASGDEHRSVATAVVRGKFVGLVLTPATCAAMRAERPRCEPSLHRAFALVLATSHF